MIYDWAFQQQITQQHETRAYLHINNPLQVSRCFSNDATTTTTYSNKKGKRGFETLDDLSFSSITHHDLIFSTLRANEILDDFELWLLRQTIKNPRISLKLCNKFDRSNKRNTTLKDLGHFGHLKREYTFQSQMQLPCLKDEQSGWFCWVQGNLILLDSAPAALGWYGCSTGLQLLISGLSLRSSLHYKSEYRQSKWLYPNLLLFSTQTIDFR